VKIDTDLDYRQTLSMQLFTSYSSHPPSANAVFGYIDSLDTNSISRLMIHKNFIDYLSTLPADNVVPYAKNILTAFKALGPTYYRETPAPKPDADSLVTGFNEEYVDRHGELSWLRLLFLRVELLFCVLSFLADNFIFSDC
jgi:hypothetical protein